MSFFSAVEMNAQEIIEKVGRGVLEALRTNELFLGVEQLEFENADIHPEYITTVKIGENLTGPSVVVSLETQMKLLRSQALAHVRMKKMNDTAGLNELEKSLKTFEFGEADRQRLDILVRESDPLWAPLLMVEAKLGIRNLTGVKKDIDRVVKLLEMYEVATIFDDSDIYGAVVFHLMKEGVNAAGLKEDAKNFVDKIEAHLLTLSAEYPWLRHKVGLLNSNQLVGDVSGYEEIQHDGTIENVFAKERFAFSPGLILLGNAADINEVQFG